MITCPVCDHTQASGDECEQCGKRFAARAAAGGDVPRLAELESTPYDDSDTEIRTERLTDLELTQLRGGPDLPLASFPELERTEPGGIVDVDAPPLPDLDAGRAPDDGVRTEIPWGAMTCRYCGHQQVEGILCDRCGMRLPSFGSDGAAAAADPAGAIDDDLRVRCKCGSPARPGQHCGNCGDMVALPTDA
ncbi:MAG TPA: hypothetical protein VIG99_32805 [Myxococcaceae bacterium]|jgi:hypothetical protein